jgi:hypothetical protein
VSHPSLSSFDRDSGYEVINGVELGFVVGVPTQRRCAAAVISVNACGMPESPLLCRRFGTEIATSVHDWTERIEGNEPLKPVSGLHLCLFFTVGSQEQTVTTQTS